MVKLRLMRFGRRKRAAFRLVAVENNKRRDGKAIEFLGYYHPYENPATISIKEDEVYEWLKKGADPSDTFRSLLKKMGMWEKWTMLKAGKDVSEVKVERKEEKAKLSTFEKKRRAEASKKKEEVKEETASVKAPKTEEVPKSEEAPVKEKA